MSGRKIWPILLAVWLVLWGLLQITNIQVEASGLILGILAIVTAVVIGFDR